MIKEKIEIKTINFFPILLSLLISAFLISIFNENNNKVFYALLIIIFFISNYLNRGKLQVEHIDDILNFSWKKRPLFSSFKELQIKTNDILYASYIDGYKTPDRIKIIGLKRQITQEISILDKNDLRYNLIEPIKNGIDFNTSTALKKENSSYYKKVNFIRVITLFIFIGFLFFFLSTIVWYYLSELRYILGISFFSFGGMLLSFFIYYYSKLSISNFFAPDNYPWINI